MLFVLLFYFRIGQKESLFQGDRQGDGSEVQEAETLAKVSIVGRPPDGLKVIKFPFKMLFSQRNNQDWSKINFHCSFSGNKCNKMSFFWSLVLTLR